MVGIGPVGGQTTEPARLCQDGMTPPAGAVQKPQLPSCPQPVIGIIKRFRELGVFVQAPSSSGGVALMYVRDVASAA